MSYEPYNLNQPMHLLLRDVARRIEAQLLEDGILKKFGYLPAVEQLIDQYNAELTKAWDAANKPQPAQSEGKTE